MDMVNNSHVGHKIAFSYYSGKWYENERKMENVMELK